ncbi:hypothetical protein FRB95_007447 [Tulasnella sp. JGI-2019a]|nr:hypothetical protein FRB93_001431 [Tulasnella sp. JGI-2019a]KAG9027715.1 hypothetical protein FRB95_007447 [Tulasnella sp. JGI-2019a]
MSFVESPTFPTKLNTDADDQRRGNKTMSSFITNYPTKEPSQPAPVALPIPPQPPVNYAPTNHTISTRNKLQVTPHAASQAIHLFVAYELQRAGFSGAEPRAMELVERLVTNFFAEVAGMSHDYAELGNRAMPHVRDVLDSCRNKGIELPSLKSAIKTGNHHRKKRKISHMFKTPTITIPPAPPRPAELLHSDSEDEDKEPSALDKNGEAPTPTTTKPSVSASKRSAPSHPRSLMSLPPQFPKLPPKHTYLRTDPPAPTTTSLSTLQEKINNAAIIQDSLRNLIQATEGPPEPKKKDVATDDDAVQQANMPVPLGLGSLVNWERASGSRKPVRWKV